MPYASAVSIRLTSSSTARRSTRLHSSAVARLAPDAVAGDRRLLAAEEDDARGHVRRPFESKNPVSLADIPLADMSVVGVVNV